MNTYDFAHRSDRASGSKALSDDTRRTHSPLYGAGGLSAMAQADELRALQMRADGDPATADPHAVAAQGVSGVGGRLPHADRIQAAFGRHDISDVQAHVGGAAQHAAMALNAQAYATGRSVAFARAPDLHTAAHEAAHVVQQRGGVSLKGGVGQAGDAYEQHADAVADAVVAGRSAEDLLGQFAGTGGGGAAVQRKEGAVGAARAKAPSFVTVHPNEPAGQVTRPGESDAEVITFPALHPGLTGPEEGMPIPIAGSDALAFVTTRSKRARGGHGRGATHMLIDRTRAKDAGGMGQILLGPAVTRLHGWLGQQRAAVGAIDVLDGHFMTLWQKGVLDTDYRVRDQTAVTRMLGRLKHSGHADAYPTVEANRSGQMMGAVSKLTQADTALREHGARVDLFDTHAVALRAAAAAARIEIEAHFTRRAVSMATNEKAAIERESAETAAVIGAIFEMGSGALAVRRGLVGPRSTEGGGVSVGDIGIMKALATYLTRPAHASTLASARQKVGRLKMQLRGHEATALRSKLEGLVISIGGYERMVANIAPLTAGYLRGKREAYAHFGSHAGVALARMDRPHAPASGAYDGQDRESRGRIQRVFAYGLEFEAIEAIARSIEWPEVEGEVPLGGHLAGHPQTRRLLHRMGAEASKLRWWRDRILGVTGLLSQIRVTTKAISTISGDER